MEIKNYSCNLNKTNRKNSPMFPKSIRGLIIGASGCGKTTILLNLLLRPGWLDYNHLFIFGKSMKQQPEYILLREALEAGLNKETINGIFENMQEIESRDIPQRELIEEAKEQQKNKKGTKITPCFNETDEEVPDPKDLNTSNKNLMIFDDLLKEKQEVPEKYYTRGRHSNTDCFYLSQSFFSLPRHTIRGNSNFIILFDLPEKDIYNIYTDYASRDMTIDEFKNFLYTCWAEPFGFAIIDRSSPRNQGKYRHGFSRFYVPLYEPSTNFINYFNIYICIILPVVIGNIIKNNI